MSKQDKQDKRIYVYLTDNELQLINNFIDGLPFRPSNSELFRKIIMERVSCHG